jgi:kumamolisin
MSKHFLSGSDRKPLAGATLTGPADPQERLEVTLVLRHNAVAGLQDRVERLSKGDYSLAPLSHAEFLAQHGARAEDIEAVTKFADQHDLSVVSVSRARRSVVLSGSVKDFNEAFSVKLQHYDHQGGAYRGREGEITLPDTLKDAVQAVLGLDNRPQARAHFRKHTSPQAAGQPVSYPPTTVAALYGFPAATGAGQTIAIVEFGGGTRSADLNQYFPLLGLHRPKILSISVDHGRNHATGSPDGDGEVMLDIEVAGSVAPGATIAVYYAPNTDAGFLDAVTTAIHDTTHKPSVLSISWGGPESSWTAQAIQALDQAFQDAAALGITVCVAAGDGGSTDGVTDGANHVDFPASSPHVLACGGTSLQADGDTIASETVWNDLPNGGATGGGVSTVFPVPSWQQGLSATATSGEAQALKFRGVPDVSGNADPETGYAVRVDGSNTVIGGTSAVAPLWAALIARINQLRANASLAPVGFINPILYADEAALNDIETGNNGGFAATEGWDACTGLGSPDGQILAAALVNNSGDTPNTGTQGATDKAFMAKGNAFMAKGNAFMAKGNTFISKGNAFMAKGNAFMAKGNDEVPPQRHRSEEPFGHSLMKGR